MTTFEQAEPAGDPGPVVTGGEGVARAGGAPPDQSSAVPPRPGHESGDGGSPARRTARAPIIVVDRVSKAYRVRGRRGGLVDTLYRHLTGAAVPTTVVWALRDVSFQVHAGECLGVIGPNGAGKSTLLRILAGIAHPSSGRVQAHGRIAVQLGLGAAFNAYLTGWENVRLQGTALGLTNREVTRLLPNVVEFAGLEESMDRPLWTYSSGMTARLGLAVAAHVECDLLLLDEALSAGDLVFRQRCQSHLEDLRRQGTTLVVITHGLDEVRRLCDRVLWLDDGRVRALGATTEVVDRYAQHGREATTPEAPATRRA